MKPREFIDMIQIKNIFLLTLLLLTSACGYQLRGSIDLPEGLKHIYLQSGSAQLQQTMRKTLKSSDGQLVSSIDQAKLVVQVLKEKMHKRVLSLSSTGRASEYEIIYKLEFNLVSPSGNILSKAQRIEIKKDYFNNQEQILGKNNEEKVIKDEIYRKAVRTILNRSRVILEKLEK